MSSKRKQLQTFVWEGKNKRGSKVSGEMAAVSPAIIEAELRRQSIDPIKVRKKKKSLFSNEKPISSLDIVVFTRHLATMISAGLPLVQALDIVARGSDKPKMQTLLMTIKSDISGGKSFAESLHHHPKYFDNLFCNLIRAAELSGTLDVMLKRVADYLEKTESLKKKIKKALTYPAAVLFVTFIVSAILLVFVVPQFEKLFSSFDAELPAFTRAVVVLSEVLEHYWWLVLGGIGASIAAFVTARKRSTKFSDIIDRAILKAPVFGKLIEKSIIARITRTLATTLAAGIPIIDALQSVARISNNSVYRYALEQVKEDVTTGQSIHLAMTTTHLFPNMVIQMIAVGEESGSIEDMLGKIASYYEEDVDHMVNNLSSLIEPLIMVILGVIIGSFVVAMYMPIFKLGSIF